jgi:hypothetical protein
MTEKRRAVILHPDEVRNARPGRGDAGAAELVFDMPFNDKSERIREGDEVVYDGRPYRVGRKEDLRPPLVAERTVEFSLVPPAKDK